ncbi:MAG: hypothetical protein ACTHJ5_12740 [Ilyomonas sp.]
MPYKSLLLSLLLSTIYKISIASVFIVSSNADTGTGSLREAITKAAVNGTNITDTIKFNIIDVSIEGRTIVLESPLPSISSNVIIDGTTQAGNKFGVSDAKIKLSLEHAASVFICLFVENAFNVQIYGLYLSGQENIGELYGIQLKNSYNVIIGDRGKGNVINKGTWNITNSYYNFYTDDSHSVSIKGNMKERKVQTQV